MNDEEMKALCNIIKTCTLSTDELRVFMAKAALFMVKKELKDEFLQYAADLDLAAASLLERAE